MAELSSIPLLNDANLVAYYKCENTSDSKGTYTLANTNSVAFNTGVYGNAADFGTNNTNKTLGTAHNLGIDGGSISIVAWVKLYGGDLTSDGTICFVGQSSGTSYVRNDINYMYYGGATNFTYRRVKNNIGNDDCNWPFALGSTQAHHICATYDGTTSRFYVDGEFGTSVAASGNGAAPGNNSFWLGAGDSGGASPTATKFASGLIDDVAIFNRVLTAAEIKSIYVTSSSGLYNKIW